MMDVIAALVVVATLYFIVRGTEVRLALLAGGAAPALASLKPEAWFDAFASSMVQAGLLTASLPAIGFTSVIKRVKCDQASGAAGRRAVEFAARGHDSGGNAGQEGLSIAITSAAGTPAAVGAGLIPAMIGLGVLPAMAAATAIAAGYAGGSAVAIAKRTAVPALSAAILVVIILGFIG